MVCRVEARFFSEKGNISVGCSEKRPLGSTGLWLEK